MIIFSNIMSNNPSFYGKGKKIISAIIIIMKLFSYRSNHKNLEDCLVFIRKEQTIPSFIRKKYITFTICSIVSWENVPPHTVRVNKKTNETTFHIQDK